MALTVGVDTYASLDDADAYWDDRNDDVWLEATDFAKAAALREATQYLDGSFDWIGWLRSETQPLAWPRTYARITDGPFRGKLVTDSVPSKVREATCELARHALEERLEEPQDRGGMIKSEAVEGAVSVTYMDGAPAHKDYSFVRKILRGLYHSHSKLVRS